jgi:hypothetical protein
MNTQAKNNSMWVAAAADDAPIFYSESKQAVSCRKKPARGEKAVGKLTFVLAPDDTLYVAEKTRGHFTTQ